MPERTTKDKWTSPRCLFSLPGASSSSLVARRPRMKPGAGWLPISCPPLSTLKSPGWSSALVLLHTYLFIFLFSCSLSHPGQTLFFFFKPPWFSPFVCPPAPLTRPGACWPPTWTGIPPPTLSTTATSSTSCCHMTSRCPTG